MSLEIRELSIKVSVNQDTQQPDSSETGPVTSSSENVNSTTEDTSAIVADCVEQVIEILKDKFKDW
jgi:hypothetical protein